MDSSIDYVFNREDVNDTTTQAVTRLFDSKRLSHKITTLNGEWNFAYNFHSAARRQLDLAEQVLEFSWHRMYTSPLDNEWGLRAAVKRYRRLMTLAQFRGPIEQLELGMSGCSGVTHLDVDLVWRTHILAPREYRWFCNETFGGLVLNIPSPLVSTDQKRSSSMIHLRFTSKSSEKSMLCAFAGHVSMSAEPTIQAHGT
ncbi:hypothetical protein SNK04_010096 [Fusarium graminearum]